MLLKTTHSEWFYLLFTSQVRGLVVEGGFGQVLLQAWDAQVTRCSGGQVARCSIANCAQALLHFFQNYFDALRRDAEKQFKSAIKQQPMIGTFLMLGKVIQYVLFWCIGYCCVLWHLSNAGQGHSICSFLIYWLLLCFVKVYLRLDQPLAALEVRWDCGIHILSQFSLSL